MPDLISTAAADAESGVVLCYEKDGLDCESIAAVAGLALPEVRRILTLRSALYRSNERQGLEDLTASDLQNAFGVVREIMGNRETSSFARLQAAKIIIERKRPIVEHNSQVNGVAQMIADGINAAAARRERLFSPTPVEATEVQRG